MSQSSHPRCRFGSTNCQSFTEPLAVSHITYFVVLFWLCLLLQVAQGAVATAQRVAAHFKTLSNRQVLKSYVLSGCSLNWLNEIDFDWICRFTLSSQKPLFAALILITLAAVLPAVLVLWVKALDAGAINLFNLLNFFSHLSSLTSSAFQSFAFYIFLISQHLYICTSLISHPAS